MALTKGTPGSFQFTSAPSGSTAFTQMSGTSRKLFVTVALGVDAGSAPTVTGITCNTVAMTYVNSTAQGTQNRIYLYELNDATTGTLEVTLSTGTGANVAVGYCEWSGADQAASASSSTINNGNTSTGTITLTGTTSGNTVLAAFTNYWPEIASIPLGLGGSQTREWELYVSSGDNTYCLGSTKAGGGDITQTVSIVNTRQWLAVAVEVKAAGASSGIAFDSASSVAANAGSGGCSWNHTIGGGDDRILIVGLFFQEQESSPTTITCTYNSVNMTSVGRFDAGQYDRTLALYMMKEADLPSAGTYAVTFSFGATEYYAGGGAMSFSGVDQTTAAHNYDEQYQEATVSQVASFALTSATDEVCVAMMVGQCAETLTDNNTNRWNRWDVTGALNGHQGSSKAGAATTTFTWTFGGTSEQGYYNVGASLKNVSGGSPDGYIEATRVYSP